MGRNYDLIREKIAEVISGFKNYTEKSNNNGFYLPNNAREADFSKLTNAKAKFSICSPSKLNLLPNEFIMMTIRSHDQFNTTVYGLNDRYRGIFNERRVVFINEIDLKKLGYKHLDQVNIMSNYDNQIRTAKNFWLVKYDIPAGNLASYFPETNVLVPIHLFAKKSNTPISKSIVVKLEKINQPI